MLDLLRNIIQLIAEFPLVTFVVAVVFYVLSKKLKGNWFKALIPFVVLLAIGLALWFFPSVINSSNCSDGVKIADCTLDDQHNPMFVGMYMTFFSAAILCIGLVVGVISNGAPKKINTTKIKKNINKTYASFLKKDSLHSTQTRVQIMAIVLIGTPLIAYVLGKISSFLRNDPSGLNETVSVFLGFTVAILGILIGIIVSFVTRNSKNQTAALTAYVAPSAVFLMWCVVNM